LGGRVQGVRQDPGDGALVVGTGRDSVTVSAPEHADVVGLRPRAGILNDIVLLGPEL